MASPSTLRLRGTRPVVDSAESFVRGVAKSGHMVHFFGRTVASIPTMFRHYRREMMRLLSDIAWGNGSIVVGGGTIAVALALGLIAGALVAVEGYSILSLLGLGPATGLISSFATTRELAPIMVGMAFIAQAGCRFTAQLGAMRINEEIDSLEAMAIKPIPFLVTTRAVASVIAVVPLFLVALGVAYLACQFSVVLVSGQSNGSYLHYFSLFVNGRDVLYSTFKASVFVFISSTIQSYYGFVAAGGPAGVGTAAGRAMRTSVTAVVVVNMLLTMALWGVESGARFGG
ncbi:ABC transporter permease [Mycobacterium koreense]|uniref:ABC transporter permease n=1 Tax=Mycolicibacillus koreensis TaxID=1069220 RepID=A0A7I7SDU1_9MYCO|nr:ABC transporter permease [Mycolicibacillus koreensis]MCV7249964.1 ABC transporter permease [Mycolicibacillus koreensis]ODR05809.1 ABC transporter permease [Mycolicibacillus koreensis]OSC24591.1 ABC transporter permease [Mycolicibacillus koreensis]BBY54680.1 ABC transporter permease [Mycolicibacillus koreensis]